MCGIAGIIDFHSPPDKGDVAPMVDVQVHRGPDEAGMVVDGPIAMGMRRLSIIDLDGGAQPIYNEDRTIAVVFNGEIYNYVELREELLPRGHRFSTRCDTEVLVHLYEEYGLDFVDHLNGMFSIALWDAQRQRLVLARDRMGIKPLYYARHGRRWLFASEAKAMLTQPYVNTDLDHTALADYLTLGYIPREASAYGTIRRLLPGEQAVVTSEGMERRQYWNLADAGSGQNGVTPQEIRELFDDAVRLRMRSDVPIASFLSGGVDSSLVTLSVNGESPEPLQTFTATFEKTAFDEAPYAQEVSARAATRHREFEVSTLDVDRLLPRIMWYMDEPMSDSSVLPNYLISEYAARYVKVCLSGLGGDELFGGYPRYSADGRGRVQRLFGGLPVLARALAPVVETFHTDYGLELYLAGGDTSDQWRSYLRKLSIFTEPALRNLGNTHEGAAADIIRALWKAYPSKDYVGQRQFVDQHLYLPDQILAISDRMSMAHSLEVRVPFLDHRLVLMAGRIPSALKQLNGDFKLVLKESFKDRLPTSIQDRAKWGFDTPLNRWVRQPAVYRALQMLPSGRLVELGLATPRGVEEIVGTPDRANYHARRAWSLLALETWLRVQGRQEAPQESLQELLAT